MTTSHHYELSLEWTGDRGSGTSSPRAYGRGHLVAAPGKPSIPGSADRAFRGDADRWNPEELLVVSLAQCHMLWYLDLAARAGVVVTAYTDNPLGTMVENADGSGQFERVVLRPAVTITDRGQLGLSHRLHERAHDVCFIARSVNFPVSCEPAVQVSPPG